MFSVQVNASNINDKKAFISVFTDFIIETANNLVIDDLKRVVVTEDYNNDIADFALRNCHRITHAYDYEEARTHPFDDSSSHKEAIFLSNKYFASQNNNKCTGIKKFVRNSKDYQQLHTTLRHELSHVHELGITKRFLWYKPEHLKEQDAFLMPSLYLWSEYFACRSELMLDYSYENLTSTLINSIRLIELECQILRLKYINGTIGEEEYKEMVYRKNIRYILELAARIVGYFSSSSKDIRIMKYHNCENMHREIYIFKKLISLDNYLSELFHQYPHWENESILQMLCQFQSDYLHSFVV